MPACKRAGPPAGRFLGLRLSFFLPSSCYATMLIRELTKKPTDKDFQMSLQH
jgi:tRNA(Glu) U13 pseudouridine synthase TruD